MKRDNTAAEGLSLPSLPTAKRRRLDNTRHCFLPALPNGTKTHSNPSNNGIASVAVGDHSPRVHNIMTLPKELLCCIFAFFDVKELFLLQQVCKKWSTLVWDLQTRIDFSLFSHSHKVNDQLFKLVVSKLPRSLHTIVISSCDKISDHGFSCLTRITHLRKLIAPNCQITTAALKYITHLTSLRTLSLLDLVCSSSERVSNNRHQRQCDDIYLLTCLTNLRRLAIQTCERGDFLYSIRHFTRLKKLNLFYCMMQQRDLEAIVSLSNLEELVFGELENIAPEDFVHLRQLSKLLKLNISMTDVEDEHIAYLSSLTQITQLNIKDCCQLTDRALLHLSSLTTLRVFRASGCNFTNESLRCLSAFRNLRTLDLSFCEHADSRFLYSLTTLIHLNVLDLKGLLLPSYDGEDPIDCLFRYCTNIRYLCLGSSKFTGEHTPNITRLVHLHTLDLIDCSLSDEGLEYISYLPSLITFDCSHCPSVTDAGLRHLSRLTRLKKLFFAQNPQITDWGVRFLSVLTELTHISHSQAAVTDEGMQYLTALTSLRDLNLVDCSKLTDKSLKYITFLHRLESINCFLHLTDDGLQWLTRLRSLHSLFLSKSKLITCNGIKNLMKLKKLDSVLLPSHFTEEQLSHLQRKYTHLSISRLEENDCEVDG
jgi:hypothetical protein